MKIKIKKITIVFLALVCFVFAIKNKYGGRFSIRLKKPDSLSFSPSDYLNMIFYSLIYENLFYLKNDGKVVSNVFSTFSYDRQARTVTLALRGNLSFADGSPITTATVKSSLGAFLDKNLATARRARSAIKNIKSGKNRVVIELLYDRPDFISLLTAPELVLLSGTSRAYSGIYYPAEVVADDYIVLMANPYYPGGRSYVDSVKVLFRDTEDIPQLFVAIPGADYRGYGEREVGIYQNYYVLFPDEKVGQNTRIALYSLLKDFYSQLKDTYKDKGLENLDVFTSAAESPITLNIKTFSNYKIRSILRYAKIRLYISNSLHTMEEKFQEFLKTKRVPIETVYLGDNQLRDFMDNGGVKYLLMSRTFSKRMPLEEKIDKIVREMSFNRFNEKYLTMINELDEVKLLNDEELMLNQVAAILERIVGDGFILPLYQRKYSLYIKERLEGIEIDYYGRPLFQGVRIK